MAHARSADLTIAYDDRGSGDPALLFLPGWCAGRAVFDDLATRMAAHHRTLAMDWRGHGGSDPAPDDFGWSDLADDAIAVIEASGAREIVPVASAHAGWVAIELRRRLGARIPKIVCVDWIMGEPPQPFVAALAAMRDFAQAFAVRDQLFAMWTSGVDHPGVLAFVTETMGSYPRSMWARGAREVAAAYERYGSPLRALSALAPSVPTLHLYSQPDTAAFLDAQRAFAAAHPWFSVHKLSGKSHFPSLEVPEEMQAPLEELLSPLRNS